MCIHYVLGTQCRASLMDNYSKDKILTEARSMNGFVVSPNTRKHTLILIEQMLDDEEVRVIERFGNGQGCRLGVM